MFLIYAKALINAPNGHEAKLLPKVSAFMEGFNMRLTLLTKLIDVSGISNIRCNDNLYS